MATYYLKSTDSDLTGGADFSKEVSAGAVAAGSIAVSVANSSTETSYAFTKPHKPSNAAWGTWGGTVKVNVTTAVANMFLAVQFDRVNSAGTVQESSTATAEQQLSSTGVFTFTVASKAWSAGACGDRLRIRFIFRSANSHGGALSVTIETGTTNTEIAISSLTEHTGTCYGTFALVPQQFEANHTTKIATGATTNDGVTTKLNLDALIGAWDNADQLTAKVEVDPVATSFSGTASNNANIALQVDPDSPYIRRSHSTVYDPTRKRMLLFGGYNGTSNFNDVWELTLDDIASPTPQWRQLAPTGTPPTARRTQVAFFDNTNNRMIVGFGFTTADNNDMYELDFSSSRDGVWATLSPTGTVPAARSQSSICVDQANQKAYLVCGWGAARYNDIQEFDFSTNNGAWTEKKADGAVGSPSKRNDTACIFDATNGRIVMFGGYDGTNRKNDTWTFTIATTTFLEITSTVGTAPSTRELMFCALDTTNNRMVIFGGRNGTAAGDVRTDYAYLSLGLATEAWSVITPTSGETPYGAWTNAGCYDPNHKLFLCMGGFDNSLEHQRSVLAIDCSNSGTLSMKEVILNQYLRGRDAMAYASNPDLNESLAVGGYARVITDLVNGNHTNEMWIYNHTDGYWRPALRGVAAIGYVNREGAVAIYDTNRNRFIIWGGLAGNNTSNNTYFNDTWELKADANGEYQLTKLATTGTKPSARWLAAAVYDAVNDRMVIFGGDNGSSYLNDVYALSFSGGADGAWSSITPSGTAHTAVRQCGYAYDSTNNRFYIFGGATGVNSFTNTNHYISLGSGTEAWSSALATSPTARRGMVCRYDAGKGKIICFGGFNGTICLNDLYTYSVSGNSWSTLTPSTNPEARRSMFCGIDTTNDKMVIFGGRDAADAALSFNSRANTYELDYSNATESNWNWTKKDPVIYLNGSVPVTSLSAGTSYHWQTWVTGTSGLDSAKISYGGNAESAADFVTASAGAIAYTITKSLQYAVVRTPSAITKSLQYTVKVSVSAITKSLQYAVRTTSAAITKSLQYVVTGTPAAITKSLKYTVITTPSALTKSLTYAVLTTPSAVTKSLTYAVTAAQTVTKTLAYEVTAAATVTKSLQYTILTTSSVTKSLAYIVVNQSTLTKSLKYTIISTPAAVTKSLQYAVATTPTALTKSLQYSVTVSSAITKSLAYSIKATQAVTKFLQYIVVSAQSITKSLKYTIIGTPSAVTKSLQYAVVVTPAIITKSLQYEVLVSSTITKSLRYAVITAQSVTKSLAYIVINQATITKSLTYSVITTPATITKSLQYAIATASTLTKTLAYEVLTTSAITKSLQYIVVSAQSVTKSLKYTIITTPTALTKSLQYTVIVTPTALTKSLQYAVITASTLTKSLQYIVTSSQALTKSLKYTVITPQSVTKSLQYAVVVTPSAITKSLQYAVITASTIQKSLQYNIQGTQTFSLTKSLTYDVVTTSSVTKSLQYIVVSAQSLTKSLKYTVITTPSTITKSLQYAVIVTVSALTKSLQYAVLIASSVTKSLSYEVTSAQSITKSLKYTIIGTPSAVTKALTYAVITTPSALTKSLVYHVVTTSSVTKGLVYEVTSAQTVTKSLQYIVVSAQSLTKSLKYTIISTPTALTRSLQYNVLPAPVTITKSLQYAVLVASSLTKSLAYEVLTTASITKTLQYIVVSAQSLTKSLKYTIIGTPAAVTKSLTYEIITTSAVTKSLTYAVLVASTVTKSLAYEVVSAQTITKALRYVVLSAQSVTKSLTYTVLTTPAAITKTLEYSVSLPPSTITKTLKYTVITSSTIQKTLNYAVQVVQSVTKSLTYDVVVSQSITKSLAYAIKASASLTKSLQYTIVGTPSAVTKSLKYTVVTQQTVTKSLTYDVVAVSSVTKTLQYAVVSTQSITKSLTYEIFTLATYTITKSLQYAIALAVSITKSLAYDVVTTSAITKSLAYAVRVSVAVSKSLQYEVVSPQSVTKSLTYSVIVQGTTITKTLAYNVAVPTMLTKSLRYIVTSTPAITKSLQYTIFTTPTPLTKSLQYYVLANPYSKNPQYSKTDGYTKNPQYSQNPQFSKVGQYWRF